MLCYFCIVIFSAKNSIIRYFAIAFCAIFLAQITLDAASKMNQNEKKQVLVEKEMEDSDDDSPIKEKEIEKEEDCKELNYIADLMIFVQNNIQTLHKQQQNDDLPQGFCKMFSPPPDGNIVLS
jgi:flagellar biosynthesis component FlhA